MDEKCANLIEEDLIKRLLSQLLELTNQVKAEEGFKNEMAKQLIRNGYDFFNGKEENTIDADHVIKILTLAVNNTLTTKVEATLSDPKDVDDGLDETESSREKLEKLLDINDGKSMDDYLTKGWKDTLKTATSPLDLARYVKKSAPLWFVRNLLKRQFEVQWATESGDPRDFTFYEFCEEEGTTKHMKYKGRKAQLNVQLYKECTKRSPKELDITEEELCPPVYLKTTEGWKTWKATGGKFELVRCDEDFKWLNESIRNFVLDNADEMRSDQDGDQNKGEGNALEKSLEKPALYWAVVQEDFKSGGSLQFKEISRTQVYVGKAENGIRGKWLDDSGSHCELMKRCVDNVKAMTIYDPLRLKGVHLVDARLALARIRGDNCAVFLLKTFGDDVEKAVISREKAVAVCAEANSEWKKAKKAYADAEKLKKAAQSQQPDRTKELRRAKKAANNAKGILDNASETVKNAQQMVLEADSVLEKTRDPMDAEVSERLRNAEAQHREGKRIGRANMNIIPNDGDSYRSPWKPKNMAFGMNKY